MPKYLYAEIRIGSYIEDIPEEDGLWNDYVRMHDFVTWSGVQCVAKRHLTEKQYFVFVLRGKYGILYHQFRDYSGISIEACHYRMGLAIKKLRKIFEKYLNSRDNIGGGFKRHVELEKMLRSGVYYFRF
jgi:hypothetical protein